MSTRHFCDRCGKDYVVMEKVSNTHHTHTKMAWNRVYRFNESSYLNYVLGEWGRVNPGNIDVCRDCLSDLGDAVMKWWKV